MWQQLHAHFTEPELVELGSFIGYIAGGQRWISTLGIGHGEVLAETTIGLSAEAARKIAEQQNSNPGSESSQAHLSARDSAGAER